MKAGVYSIVYVFVKMADTFQAFFSDCNFPDCYPYWWGIWFQGTPPQIRVRISDSWKMMKVKKERRLGSVKVSSIWKEMWGKKRQRSCEVEPETSLRELRDALFSVAWWSASFAGFDTSLYWYIWGNRRWRPRPNPLHLPASVLLSKQTISLYLYTTLPHSPLSWQTGERRKRSRLLFFF